MICSKRNLVRQQYSCKLPTTQQTRQTVLLHQHQYKQDHPATLEIVPSTPRSQSRIAKSTGRYESAKYWKAMYEMLQNIIEESHEKSVKLADIPDLLTVNKVKPKDDAAKNKLRVTNVHGSTEAQDVLNKVASLDNEKQEKSRRAEKKKGTKEYPKGMVLSLQATMSL